MQTEDVSFLSVDANGNFTSNGYIAVGVTPNTPDPTRGDNGAGLFATDEEVGLRWFFSSAYADDPPIPGGHRADLMRRSRAVSVIGMAGMMAANGMSLRTRLVA